MTTIENEYLRVSIRPQGAELTSIYNKKENIEHLWGSNPDIWPWHAPNLFPIVGGLNNDTLHVDGAEYHMTRHGFTRTSTFKKVESTKTHAKYSLNFSEDTLAVYPYKFEFQILYDLIDNALRISYKVVNHDDKTIYFSVGAHPAFNVPFNKDKGEAYEDYYLEFELDEKLETHVLSSTGNFNGEVEHIPTENKKLALTRELFAKDALVFKNLKSREISLRSNKHNSYISVEYPHFNYMGIWAKYGADFVCIEPWLGCSDTDNKITDIKQKEAIQTVEKGHVFEVEYFIKTSY
jgi:galactose mutarotase-like enzyme